MKYAGRSGHNPLCEGATALLNEVIEDRKIFYASKKYISMNNTFIDVTPSPTSGENNDLNYGIKKANGNNVDIFYSVHLNKCYDSYNGALGSEIWLYDTNSKLITQANRILKNLEKLGFKNRGIKYSSVEKKQLVELHNSKMPSMIIECFFLEATGDVALYRKLGADAIGKAISEGITGKSVITQNDSETISKPIVENKILLLQKVANRVGIRGANDKALIEDGIDGVNTIEAKRRLKVYIDSVLS
ncbi:MAG: N-acetylmuramoyl-L-alanine amidase [Clostridium sp.]|jgi:N-acetylmuramoyl-L-alanine amidase